MTEQPDITEKDFKLLNEALDSFSIRIRDSEKFPDTIIKILGQDDPAFLRAIHDDRRIQEAADRLKRNVREKGDDVRLLQAKLIMLKRYLAEMANLKEASNIANSK